MSISTTLTRSLSNAKSNSFMLLRLHNQIKLNEGIYPLSWQAVRHDISPLFFFPCSIFLPKAKQKKRSVPLNYETNKAWHYSRELFERTRILFRTHIFSRRKLLLRLNQPSLQSRSESSLVRHMSGATFGTGLKRFTSHRNPSWMNKFPCVRFATLSIPSFINLNLKLRVKALDYSNWE